MGRTATVSVVAWCALAAVLGTSCGGGGGDDSVAEAPPDSTASSATEMSAVSQSESSSSNDASTTDEPSSTVVVVIEDGRVTDAALASLLAGDEIDPAAAQTVIDELDALSDDEWIAAGNDLSERAEFEAAKVSGLEAAIGGPEATEAALRGAWSMIGTDVDAAAATDLAAALPPDSAPSTSVAPSGLRSGFAKATSAPSTSAVGTIGLMMGWMGLSSIGDPVVSASNEFKTDQYAENTSKGTIITGAVEQASVELEYTGQQDGVDVTFTASAVVHPCPKSDGSFDIQILIDMSATKGGAGQNTKMTVDIVGQVDDNAALTGYEATTNTQWAEFGGGNGQFLDTTMTRSSSGELGYTVNRTGGTVSNDLVSMSTLMTVMVGNDLSDRYVKSAEKAWQSGRCVQLDMSASPGPSGLAPGSQATVVAAPRSKVDGSVVGGTVTAQLSAGGKNLEPVSTPLPADAEFQYSAPDEPDQSGTVTAEARSRRGIGKGSITLDTKQQNAYQIVGGLDDFQVNQAVCDINQPFSLSGGGITAEFSGGMSGTYTYSGVFGAMGSGQYAIDLPNGPGQPGTMVGGGEGTVLGAFGASGTESYTLTPLTTCP